MRSRGWTIIQTTLLSAVLALGLLVAQPAYADPVLSKAWFTSLSADTRANLQGNLVLLAHYGGMVDAEFGPGTYGAIRGWQESLRLRPTGILTVAQMDLLEQMASEVMSDLGMSLVEDLRGHLAIMLPTGLLTTRRDRVNGTWYQDATGIFTAETFWTTELGGSLAQQYADAVKPVSERSVSYSTLRDDLYVVTGYEGDRHFYELVHSDGGGTAGFRFSYGEQFKEIGGVASVFAASYSAPISVMEAAKQVENVERTSPVTTAVTPEIALPPEVPSGSVKQKAGSDEEGVRAFGNFITIDSAPGVLALLGDIGPSTPLDFRRALRSMDNPETLVLASDGGLVASALLIAYEVAELELATYVLPDTGCYSACSFIFLAGKERLAEGELGVHQVWGENTDASSAQTVVSDILEAFGEFGVRQEVTSAMLRTRPEDMYIFDATELASWGLNTR